MSARQPGSNQEPLTALYRGCVLTVAVLLGVFVLVSLATYFVFQQPSSEVKVPNLVNTPAADAQAAAEKLGLVPKVAGGRYDDAIPAGSICATDPPAGRAVRSGRGIHLFVSKGPRNSGIPDLTGKTVPDARGLLQNRALAVGEVWSKRSSEKIGVVVAQSASPGSKVAAGTAIDLEVSGGPDFGAIHVEGSPDRLFRTVVVTLPDDGVQHHILVKIEHAGAEQVVHDRLYAPRDRAEIEISGEAGDRVIVYLDDRDILTHRL
jgi:beta-lactam-binding protein with PASTA domain